MTTVSVVVMVSLRVKNLCVSYQHGFLTHLGVPFKIFEDYPRQFYMGVLPPPGRLQPEPTVAAHDYVLSQTFHNVNGLDF